MSPDGPKPMVGGGASGVILESGNTPVPPIWLLRPGRSVHVAGVQNIDESPPDPEAAPAKDRPSASALCSLSAKAPACAPELAATSIRSDAAVSGAKRLTPMSAFLRCPGD